MLLFVLEEEENPKTKEEYEEGSTSYHGIGKQFVFVGSSNARYEKSPESNKKIECQASFTNA